MFLFYLASRYSGSGELSSCTAMRQNGHNYRFGRSGFLLTTRSVASYTFVMSLLIGLRFMALLTWSVKIILLRC